MQCFIHLSSRLSVNRQRLPTIQATEATDNHEQCLKKIILHSLSNSRTNSTQILVLIFYIVPLHNGQFLHVCTPQRNLLFSYIILGSVVSDYVSSKFKV